MTGRRNEIFNKLVEFIKIKGYTPTVREFGKYIGLNSPATVQWYLKRFEKDGLIKRINNRSIKIIGNTNE